MKKNKAFAILTALAMITSATAFASAYSIGDANNDGKINVRDCAYIASMLAQGKSGSMTAESDYNADKKINVRDAANLAFDLATGNVVSKEPLPDPPSSGYEYKGNLTATHGKEFTVLSWHGEDLNLMLDVWTKAEGIDKSKINFVNFEVGGGEASYKYDQYMLGGEDMDMFMIESDWALKYLNDDEKTIPLSELGFTEADFADQYDYTLNYGKNYNGVLKAVSYNPSPGAWCYRADLAKHFLGVNSPDEMQELVSDWDKLQNTAEKVRIASNGKTALTTTLYGLWTAYSQSRTTPWVQDNKLVVDDFCNYFINMSKSMSDNYYVTECSQWTDTWYIAGQTDVTMGYFASTWGFGKALLKSVTGGEGGATYGKWNVCQGPTPYSWGGNWICVSPKTDNADMAASFINYFTVNPETIKYYFTAKNNGNDYVEMVNNKTVMNEIVKEGKYTNGVTGEQNEIAVLNEVADKIDNEGSITPYDATIKWYFIYAIEAYCAGETTTAKECITDFKNRVADNIRDIEVN